jgi:hypothetical protein
MIISTTPDSATAHSSSREDLAIDKVARIWLWLLAAASGSTA